VPTDHILDYLATTLAGAYRRELDQEENVWRTPPFFAATLALQLTVLVQLRSWLGAVAGPVGWATVVLLSVAAIATLAALLFLLQSILPADLEHVERGPPFPDHVEQIWAKATSRPDATIESTAAEALSTVKSELTTQYASVTATNRVINRRRAACRRTAGVATLASVLVMLALVGVVVIARP